MDAAKDSSKTVRQVAILFGVDRSTVTQWIRDGKLRAMDVSRSGSKVPRYRFSQQAISELSRLLEIHPADSTAINQ